MTNRTSGNNNGRLGRSNSDCTVVGIEGSGRPPCALTRGRYEQEVKKPATERISGLYSGQILGAVVKALDLDEGFLTEKTADRFFATGNASEYSRKTVFQELGRVLVDLELVPDVASKLPEGGKTADVLAGGVSLMCKRWDLLMEWIQGRSATVSDVGGASQKFLRLATVDVALRMLGFVHLAELELLEPYVPVWAQPNGAREILRGHQSELGLKRHQLARLLEVSPTTVDNWLDGNNLPGRAHSPALARELSRGRPISAEYLETQLRRQFALARLAETAASVVGWEAVGADGGCVLVCEIHARI